jgi:hypothetical protein
MSNDYGDYPIHVIQNFPCRHAEDTEPGSLQHSIPRGILLRPVTEAMIIAINLDDEATAQAREVRRDLLKRELPSEFEYAWSGAQHLP